MAWNGSAATVPDSIANAAQLAARLGADHGSGRDRFAVQFRQSSESNTVARVQRANNDRRWEA